MVFNVSMKTYYIKTNIVDKYKTLVSICVTNISKISSRLIMAHQHGRHIFNQYIIAETLYR